MSCLIDHDEEALCLVTTQKYIFHCISPFHKQFVPDKPSLHIIINTNYHKHKFHSSRVVPCAFNYSMSKRYLYRYYKDNYISQPFLSHIQEQKMCGFITERRWSSHNKICFVSIWSKLPLYCSSTQSITLASSQSTVSNLWMFISILYMIDIVPSITYRCKYDAFIAWIVL
jgi:hypothetical protein